MILQSDEAVVVTAEGEFDDILPDGKSGVGRGGELEGRGEDVEAKITLKGRSCYNNMALYYNDDLCV